MRTHTWHGRTEGSAWSRLPGRCWLLAALCTSVVGAELRVADLRLGIESRPADFDFEISNDLGTVSGSDSFDSGFAVSARGLYALRRPGSAGGWLLGGEVSASWHQYDEESDFTSLRLRGMGGYGYALSDRWAVHGLLYVGTGVASLDLADGDTYDGFTADGSLVDYGAVAGVRYELSRHWLLEAEAGWLESDAQLEGNGYDISVQETGPTFYIGATYRFGGLPPRLE